MKMHGAILKTAGLLAASLFVLTISCKDQGQKEASRSMVIVFASGDASIVREGKEIPAKVGTVVQQNDVIKTTQGTVDLQSRDGSAVRVREMTTLNVASLMGNEGETRIEMKHGQILANVKKASSGQEFNVVTPTAIAGVRGTTFEVQVFEGYDADKTTQSSVRVLDGKVAMKPRIKALENVSQADIDNNPKLKKLAELQNNEIVLDDASRGSMDPALEKKVALLNNATEDSTDSAQALKMAEENADDITASAEPDKALVKEEAEVTVKDRMESATLTAATPEMIEKLQSGNNQEAATEIAEVRKKQQEQILNQIEEEAESQKLNSEEEIRQHYSALEKIVLKNGEVLRGATVAQTGNVLIIHTAEGVRRVSKSEIASQNFL
ncbi:MAG: FecR domain-containing protein [Leptospiraceae bacterium]|nr:FecR domain-containing protein [Leptospiraceae bacterium]